ncbi:hypothetical protein IE81DRAFT_161472 [Ceraceosorus guamensis]|uniref:Uncharacterized protein n=1 Tax=Ceraceosorus guamensis TaxID=1522189 RepID=A0A316W7J1_9BASI|nr:hypothetical protein IE81DRAFT_161472 [Ceraceosorus guamensis]PWN45554.1 hypothetical protein IE81DRAFT_161472 [Ceraceosorus guamensis]
MWLRQPPCVYAFPSIHPLVVSSDRNLAFVYALLSLDPSFTIGESLLALTLAHSRIQWCDRGWLRGRYERANGCAGERASHHRLRRRHSDANGDELGGRDLTLGMECCRFCVVSVRMTRNMGRMPTSERYNSTATDNQQSERCACGAASKRTASEVNPINDRNARSLA